MNFKHLITIGALLMSPLKAFALGAVLHVPAFEGQIHCKTTLNFLWASLRATAKDGSFLLGHSTVTKEVPHAVSPFDFDTQSLDLTVSSPRKIRFPGIYPKLQVSLFLQLFGRNTFGERFVSDIPLIEGGKLFMPAGESEMKYLSRSSYAVELFLRKTFNPLEIELRDGHLKPSKEMNPQGWRRLATAPIWSPPPLESDALSIRLY